MEPRRPLVPGPSTATAMPPQQPCEEPRKEPSRPLSRLALLLEAWTCDLNSWKHKECRSSAVGDLPWEYCRFVNLFVHKRMPQSLIDILEGPQTALSLYEPASPPFAKNESHVQEIVLTAYSRACCLQELPGAEALGPLHIQSLKHLGAVPHEEHDTLFVPHVLDLVIELGRYVTLYGYRALETMADDGISVPQQEALVVDDATIIPEWYPNHTQFEVNLIKRILYIDHYIRSLTTGAPPALQDPHQSPSFPEQWGKADIEVDAFLFRVGILDEQYLRSNRPFRPTADTLVKMYGLGARELGFIANNPRVDERIEQLQTLGRFHELTCMVGCDAVKDIREQLAFVSFAIRDSTKCEPSQAKAVEEGREARRREFKIAKLLVDQVWQDVLKSLPKGRPRRTYPQQQRCAPGRQGDWRKLNLADKQRLLHHIPELLDCFIGPNRQQITTGLIQRVTHDGNSLHPGQVMRLPPGPGHHRSVVETSRTSRNPRIGHPNMPGQIRTSIQHNQTSAPTQSHQYRHNGSTGSHALQQAVATSVVPGASPAPIQPTRTQHSASEQIGTSDNEALLVCHDGQTFPVTVTPEILGRLRQSGMGRNIFHGRTGEQ